MRQLADRHNPQLAITECHGVDQGHRRALGRVRALEGLLQIREQASSHAGAEDAHDAVCRRCGEIAGQIFRAHTPGGDELVGQQREVITVELWCRWHLQNGYSFPVDRSTRDVDAFLRSGHHPHQQPLPPRVGRKVQDGDALGPGHRVRDDLRTLALEHHRLDRDVGEGHARGGVHRLYLNPQRLRIVRHSASSPTRGGISSALDITQSDMRTVTPSLRPCQLV